jgi:hypothetical protein
LEILEISGFIFSSSCRETAKKPKTKTEGGELQGRKQSLSFFVKGF